MILLTSVAGLFGRFRFVTTVTILQQTWKVLVDFGRMGCTAAGTRTPGVIRKEIPRFLPKSWANAGAFSPLTPGSKLAQY
jgi:hypothetical protein